MFSITNIKRVKKLPFKNEEEKEKTFDFQETDIFNFNSSAVLRKEDFGGTIFVDNKNYFLTGKGLELLLSLKSNAWLAIILVAISKNFTA